MILLLSVLLPLYLVVGAVCAMVLNWHVDPEAPGFVVIRVVTVSIVVLPYLCVRHGMLPSSLHMEIRRR